ncbi:MAG: hypothetical protein LC130_32615 [Bryobacterales bacterium]|nr:hypothetical protein [Bryobacterales bacterium]MEB2363035.1 hypothetical protein [Bryobacterales bacterium]
MEPAYPAARAAAASVHANFAHHAAALTAAEGKPASLPDRDAIEAIIDTAFWASLRHEEGISPRISLAFVTPAEAECALHFERALPLAARSLTRLAPAVEGRGVHLGVWREREDLRVWGTTRRLPPFCFVLEVVAPGLLVVKQSRAEETGKFVNVAVLEGEQIKIIDQRAATLPDCPGLLTSLLGLEARFAPDGASNVLIQIATSMRAHGRGGLLLVVPAGSEAWRESIIHPVTYSIVPPFSVLAGLMQEDPGERPKQRWQDALRRAVDGIGGVTAVDGATVLTDQYELLAFGAKIVRRSGSNQVDRVLMTEPIIGASPEILEPAQLGGTRHISAAQFEHDQRDAVALVASQDGRFTVFAWSPCENMVHAHRIESLLL